jgi:predicted Zn-dependent protease
LIQAALLQNKGDQAVEWARQLQRIRPDDVIGLVLEGEVQAALKRWTAAVAAGRKAFAQSRNSETAVRLHALLLDAGQRGEADGHAAEWLRANPDDHLFQSHLASQALQAGRLDEADRLYARVLDRVANDPMALNNAAWIRVLRKQPDAVAAAERAVAAAPGSAAALDTLASALALAGQLPKALETQRRALRLAPGTPLLELHLAQLLVQADQKAEAKTILERLRRLGGRFDRQAEVADLLAKV